MSSSASKVSTILVCSCVSNNKRQRLFKLRKFNGVLLLYIIFAVGVIGGFLSPPKNAGIGFVALVWATIYGHFRAIVSLVEMRLGYVLSKL
jgi:hypothetical protein